MSYTTVSYKATCDEFYEPTVISPFECIGNSLPTINSNFAKLYDNDMELCESLAATVSAVESMVLPPIGTIMLWGGAISDISGTIKSDTDVTANSHLYIVDEDGINVNWAVCTGYNNTPNLIARFVVGAGVRIGSPSMNNSSKSMYNLSETGGEEVHTLSVGELARHKHGNGQSKTVLGSVTANFRSVRSASGSTAYDMVESITTTDTKINISSPEEGNGNAHNNTPPYYALYYIMRIK